MSYGYICTWHGKRVEITTDDPNNSTYKVQLQATAEFQKGTRQKVKSYDVNVFLAEKDGEAVVHTPNF